MLAGREREGSILCDIGAIPLIDGVADVVTLRWVVEHLERPAQVLRETVRVLRPGGVLVVLTPNARNYKVRFAKKFPNFYADVLRKRFQYAERSGRYPHFYRANTRYELARLLRSAGATETEFRYLSKPTLTPDSSLVLYVAESILCKIIDLFFVGFSADLLGVYSKVNPGGRVNLWVYDHR